MISFKTYQSDLTEEQSRYFCLKVFCYEPARTSAPSFKNICVAAMWSAIIL